MPRNATDERAAYALDLRRRGDSPHRRTIAIIPLFLYRTTLPGRVHPHGENTFVVVVTIFIIYERHTRVAAVVILIKLP